MQPSSKHSLAKTFEGVDIRTTPEGQMVAVDVLVALGLKDPRNSWRHLKKQYPELVEGSSTYSFGKGRPPETLSEKGVYKLAMVAGGPKAAQFREWASDLIQRVRQADPTLTADLIDRTQKPADLRWIADRAKARESALGLNQAIAAAGCSELTFPKVHDLNNVAVTGLTAKEIQRYRGGRTTRDLYSRTELSLVDTAQTLEVSAIGRQDARGDGAVIDIAREVSSDVAALRKKWLGPRQIPHGGVLTQEI